MIEKCFNWLHPAQIPASQQRLDWLWAAGMSTGLFIGVAGYAASFLSMPNVRLLPAIALFVFSGVAIVVLTWRSVRIRNRLAGRLALLDAKERRES